MRGNLEKTVLRNDAAMQLENEAIVGFAAEKAVHLSALFLMLANGSLEKLKLIKLLYLCEREFFRQYGQPILWDEYYSLPHGPVCSSALDCLNKKIASDLSDKFFSMSGGRKIRLAPEVKFEDLDALSEAEIQIAKTVWLEHGRKTASQLRNYSHDYCKEYTELKSGRLPISYESILTVVGNDRPRETASELESYRNILLKYS